MNPNQSSITAENKALLRAHEFNRPPHERICDDPYAVYFLPDRLFSAVDRTDQIKRAVADWENHFPGVGNAIIARTRFIDDCLKAAIRDDARQLVILGAGYDTRALRCKALKEKVVVFELDHPTTQEKKLARIEKHLDGVDGSHVRYIPIDFSTETIAEKLFASGYDDQLKTLFIWEGVTYYLSAAAVDRTLTFIHQHAVSKSRVIYDYFPPSVADGTTHLPEARALCAGLRRIGEAVRFGIEPHQIESFMHTRGFTVIQNLTHNDWQTVYFKGSNKSRTVTEMFIFVEAMVS